MAFIGDFGRVLDLLKRIYDKNPKLKDFLQKRYSDIFKIDDYNNFRKLPILRKSEYSKLQQTDLPFAGLINSKPLKYFQSPGPINNVKIADFDHYRFHKALKAAGFNENDTVLNTFGYTISPAGDMFDEACRYLNIPVFPLGPTDSAKAAEIVDTFDITAFIGTKTFLIKTAEQTKKNSLKKAYLIAEKLTEDDKLYIKERFGIEAYQGYGIAEVGLIATEGKGYKYMTLDTDALFIEHLQPNSNEEAELHQYGELVLTFFDERLPFVRFATGDLVTYENERLKGVFGRADTSVKVKGVFIHYWQFDEFCNKNNIKAKLIVEPSEKNDIITLEVSEDRAGIKDEFKRSFGLTLGSISVKQVDKNEIIDKREWKKE